MKIRQPHYYIHSIRSSRITEKVLCAALSFLLPSLAFAHDFTTWTSVNADYAIGKDFAVEAGVEYRTKNNVSATDRWGLKASGSYQALPFLKIGAGYEFHIRNTSSGWKNRHRYMVSLTESCNIGRFSLSLREQFQHTVSNKTGEFRLRTRAQAKYKINDLLRPNLSVEMYNSLHRNEHFEIARMRYRGGMEFKINRLFGLDLFYLLQDQQKELTHVAGLEVSLSF